MITLKDAIYELQARRTFNAGNLTGYDNAGSYEVRSYGVIIAFSPTWHASTDGELMPNAYSHSKTTSKHANIVKKAWGI